MANPYLTIAVTTEAAAAAAGLDDVAKAAGRVGDAGEASSSGLDAATAAADNYSSAAANAGRSAGHAADAARDFGGGVGDIGDALSKLTPAIEAAGFPGLAAGIEKATIAFDAVEGAAMLASSAMSLVAAAQTSTKLATVASTVAAYAQAAAMGVVKAATLVWTGVQWALNAALTANPIGIVIVLIALLVAGIILAWKKSETFRKVVTAAWNGIKKVVASVVNWIRATVPPVFARISAVASAVWRKMKSDVGTVKAAVVLSWRMIKSAVASVMNWINSKVSSVFNAVKSAARTAAGAVRGIWSGVRAAVQPAISAINSVIAAIQRLISWVRSVHIPNWLSKLTSVQASGFGPGPASFTVAPAGISGRAMAGGRAGASTRTVGGGGVVINVNGALDPEAVARQIERVLGAAQRRRAGVTLSRRAAGASAA